MKIHTTAVALLVSVAALTGCGDQEAPEVEAVDYSDYQDAAEREGLRREQAAAAGAGGGGGYARGWQPGHAAPSPVPGRPQTQELPGYYPHGAPNGQFVPYSSDLPGDDSTPHEVTRHRGLVME